MSLIKLQFSRLQLASMYVIMHDDELC